MASRIFWTEIEKALVMEGLVVACCNHKPFTTAKKVIVDLTFKAQEVLVKDRRKTRHSLLSWVDYHSNEIETAIYHKIRDLQKDAKKRTPEQVIAEIVENTLRPQDVELINKMEAVFRDAAAAALEKAKNELLMEFKASLDQQLEEIRESALHELKQSIKQAKEAAKDATFDTSRLSTKPVEKAKAKIVVVGCDSAQASILRRDYNEKSDIVCIQRDSSPPRNLSATSKMADKVFFLSKQAGAVFHQGLSGVNGVVNHSGGLSTLRPLLDNFLREFSTRH